MLSLGALAEAEPLEQRAGVAVGGRPASSRAAGRGRRSARAPSSSGRGRAPRACSRSGGGRPSVSAAPSSVTVPRVGGEHAEDDAHGRGLAGAVAADEAGEAAGGDVEAHVREHPVWCRSSGQVSQLQHALHATECARGRRIPRRGDDAPRAGVRTRPCWWASTAAARGRAAPSFMSTFETCVFTVASPTHSVCGDLGVRQRLGDEPEHLALAFGEASPRRRLAVAATGAVTRRGRRANRLDHAPGDLGREQRIARRDHPDGGDELAPGRRSSAGTRSRRPRAPRTRSRRGRTW